MQEINSEKKANDFEGEIDLRKVFFVLAQEKLIIISLTFFVSIIGIIYSLQLPDVYESEALLAPIEDSSSLMSGSASEFSGLAGLVGINLPSVDANSNSKKAKEVMNSLDFFENYLMPKIFLPNLMAVDYWEEENNKIIYDEGIFKENTNSWTRDFSYPKQLVPSAQESFLVFKEKHFNLQEDESTGYMILSMKHQSPLIAKQWVEIIVKEVNAYFREKDRARSEKAVIFLNKQMAATTLSEVRLVTASLAQKEIQKLTLIEANEDYVFEYIYPPSIMEEKSGPKRAFIVILFAFLGLILSIIFVFFKHHFYQGKSS